MTLLCCGVAANSLLAAVQSFTAEPPKQNPLKHCAVVYWPHQSGIFQCTFIQQGSHTFLCCAGAVCKHTVSHPVAAVAVDALHSALTDPEQCKHLLLRTHTVMGEGLRGFTEDGFDGAMRGLDGQLTSQLTLGACLFRMCAQVSVYPCCFLLSITGQAQNN